MNSHSNPNSFLSNIVFRSFKAAKHSRYAPLEGIRFDGLYKVIKSPFIYIFLTKSWFASWKGKKILERKRFSWIFSMEISIRERRPNSSSLDRRRLLTFILTLKIYFDHKSLIHLGKARIKALGYKMIVNNNPKIKKEKKIPVESTQMRTQIQDLKRKYALKGT